LIPMKLRPHEPVKFWLPCMKIDTHTHTHELWLFHNIIKKITLILSLFNLTVFLYVYFLMKFKLFNTYSLSVHCIIKIQSNKNYIRRRLHLAPFQVSRFHINSYYICTSSLRTMISCNVPVPTKSVQVRKKISSL
jgi:hypothetical protein